MKSIRGILTTLLTIAILSGTIYAQDDEFQVKSIATNGSSLFVATEDHGVYIVSDHGKNWDEIDFFSDHSNAISEIKVLGTSIFVRTYTGDLYFSKDLGKNFKKISDDLGDKQFSVLSIAMNESSLFLSMGDKKMYMSSDFGNTWKAIKTPGKGEILNIIGEKIYYSGGGLSVSEDNCESWEPINKGIPKDSWVRLLTKNGNTLFVATQKALYKSVDMGANWVLMKSDKVSMALVGIQGELFEGAWEGGALNKSNDNGDTWIASNEGIKGGTIWSILDYGEDYYAQCDESLYISTNKGDQWVRLQPSKFEIATQLEEDQEANRIKQEALDQANREKQETLNQEKLIKEKAFRLKNPQDVYDFVTCGNKLFAGTESGLFLLEDRGMTWTRIEIDPEIGKVTTVASSGNTLLATSDAFLYVSKDQGVTWTKGNNFECYIRDVTIIGSIIFTFCDDGLYKSADSGANWEKVKSVPKDTWFVGTIENRLITNQKGVINMSVDEGATWKDIDNGAEFRSVAKFGDNLIAGSILGPYVSTNEGTSWTSMNEVDVEGIHELVVSDTTIFAASNKNYGTRFSYSRDNGKTWHANSAFEWSLVYKTVVCKNDVFIRVSGEESHYELHRLSPGGGWARVKNLTDEEIAVLDKKEEEERLAYLKQLKASADYLKANPPSQRELDMIALRKKAKSYYIETNVIDFSGSIAFAAAGEDKGIYRSLDNGETWKLANKGLKVPGWTLPEPSVIRFYGDKVIIGTGIMGIFISYDNGDSWLRRSTGFPNLFSSSKGYPKVDFLNISGDTLFADLNREGQYISTDEGKTWTQHKEFEPSAAEKARIMMDEYEVKRRAALSPEERAKEDEQEWIMHSSICPRCNGKGLVWADAMDIDITLSNTNYSSSAGYTTCGKCKGRGRVSDNKKLWPQKP